MIPVIALVGRANVGKSTLFNVLTKTRDAIVADEPGVTRDRQYGISTHYEKNFIVIDTGGVGDESEQIDQLMAAQTWQAVAEAHAVIFVVDAKAGLTNNDSIVAKKLRLQNKNIFVVINKIDGLNEDLVALEFYQLGFVHVFLISAAHNRGINALVKGTLQTFAGDIFWQEDIKEEQGVKVAIVGKPNVGKSTLINSILGESRVAVFDQPGTTRDSIFIPFNRHNKNYILIDTAGVRRQSKIHNVVEKFSVIKTLQAIENANVVVFLVDGKEVIAEQDLHILGFIAKAGKALVLAVNKWDALSLEEKKHNKSELERKVKFIYFANWHFISALQNKGIGQIFTAIDQAYISATAKFATNKLSQLLEQALKEHQPPLVGGKRAKLRYAHMGGQNPLRIVLHGNKSATKLNESYKKYLENFYFKKLKITGTPVKLEFKCSNDNEETKISKHI